MKNEYSKLKWKTPQSLDTPLGFSSLENLQQPFQNLTSAVEQILKARRSAEAAEAQVGAGGTGSAEAAEAQVGAGGTGAADNEAGNGQYAKRYKPN